LHHEFDFGELETREKSPQTLLETPLKLQLARSIYFSLFQPFRLEFSFGTMGKNQGKKKVMSMAEVIATYGSQEKAALPSAPRR